VGVLAAGVWPVHAQLSAAPVAVAVAASQPQPAGPSTLEAQDIRGRFDQETVATGEVEFRRGPLRIKADRLTYTGSSSQAHATGGVDVLHGGNRYQGPELLLNVESYTGYFLKPHYYFAKRGAGGDAERWDFIDSERGRGTTVTYSSCPRDGDKTPAWQLTADHLSIDFEHNNGVAEGAVLRFYGVPILAGPTLSFPVTSARRSGWLAPSLGLDTKAGFQVAAPYYWNIAPNYDATLTPTYAAKRGLGLQTELRYLRETDQGTFNQYTLPHDKLFGSDRNSSQWLHEGSAGGWVFYNVDATRVSDDDYWKDFTRNRISITPRLLPGHAEISSRWGAWTPYASVHRWQVLQDSDTTQSVLESPYDRYPQLGVRTVQQPLGGGLNMALEFEFNRFVNPEGYRASPPFPATPPATTPLPAAPRSTGSRAHALASLSWLWATPSWRIEPRLSLNTATYALDQPLTTGAYAGQRYASRTIPSYSLDSAWTFERDTLWLGREVRQTLEPRVAYVKTPFREQAGLPRFDSALKDFSVDSIYTDNAFSGIDRVSDAHQITTGVTSRVLGAKTGAEVMRFGMAQRFALQDQRITEKDDNQPVTQSLSDVLLFGSSSLTPRWSLNAAVQYSYDQGHVERSVLGARYTPGPFRVLNLAYRLKHGESEQVDLSWQWPLYGHSRSAARNLSGTSCAGAWYTAGRINYSLRESRVTDSVLGLEYDAGCWVGRMVGKRLSTGLSTATTQIGLEIEFIGLSRLGTNNPLKVLKDNVPGYRLLRDDPAAPAAIPTPP
jgi:LPS-assembly protein